MDKRAHENHFKESNFNHYTSNRNQDQERQRQTVRGHGEDREFSSALRSGALGRY
jgi:hypothetical protein